MTRFTPADVTPEEVRAFREKNGGGLMDAKAILRTRAMLNALADLRANGTIEEKVEFLLGRFEAEILEKAERLRPLLGKGEEW